MGEERRRAVRRRTLKGAHIVFNGGHASVSCTVRNFSDEGARLCVDGVVGIPTEFTILFDGGSRRECVVKWRDPTTIGVEFKKVSMSGPRQSS